MSDRITSSTRKKYYGRTQMTQSLRQAVLDLQGAITEAEKPAAQSPVAVQLQKVLKSLTAALESERIFTMQRKRLRSHLEQEKKRLEQIIAEVTGIAVVPGEKAIQKHRVKTGGGK